MMWKNQPLFGFGKWYLNLCFVHSCNNIFLWIFYWIVMDLRTQLIKNDDVSTKMSLSIYQEARLKVDRHRTNKHIVIRRIFGTTEYDRMIQGRKFMMLNTINYIDFSNANLGLHPSIANWNWQKEIVWWQLLTKTIHVYFSGYNGTWKICCVVYYYWMNTFSRKLYDDFRPFCRIKTILFRVSNHFLTFCGFVLLSGMVIAFLRVLKFCNVQYFSMPSDIHIYNVVGTSQSNL